MPEVSREQLAASIQDGVRTSITLLCQKLERGGPSEVEMDDFLDALSTSVANAIAEATSSGVKV